MTCRTQWRVGMAGAVGLDYSAMYRVADSLGIDVTRANLQKVQTLEREVITKDEE